MESEREDSEQKGADDAPQGDIASVSHVKFISNSIHKDEVVE